MRAACARRAARCDGFRGGGPSTRASPSHAPCCARPRARRRLRAALDQRRSVPYEVVVPAATRAPRLPGSAAAGILARLCPPSARPARRGCIVATPFQAGPGYQDAQEGRWGGPRSGCRSRSTGPGARRTADGTGVARSSVSRRGPPSGSLETRGRLGCQWFAGWISGGPASRGSRARAAAPGLASGVEAARSRRSKRRHVGGRVTGTSSARTCSSAEGSAARSTAGARHPRGTGPPGARRSVPRHNETRHGNPDARSCCARPRACARPGVGASARLRLRRAGVGEEVFAPIPARGARRVEPRTSRPAHGRSRLRARRTDLPPPTMGELLARASPGDGQRRPRAARPESMRRCAWSGRCAEASPGTRSRPRVVREAGSRTSAAVSSRTCLRHVGTDGTLFRDPCRWW